MTAKTITHRIEKRFKAYSLLRLSDEGRAGPTLPFRSRRFWAREGNSGHDRIVD
jgi:hypothetical protein